MSKLRNFRAQNLNSLAPPTRQSLKCIQLHNFGLVGPNFTNSVSLKSSRLTRFSAILDFVENLKKFSAVTNFDRFSQNWHRVSLDQSTQKLRDGFFNFNFVHLLQPIKVGGDDAKLEVGPYLSNRLIF